MTFETLLSEHPFAGTGDRIRAFRTDAARKALEREHIGLDDLAALLSPGARPLLEKMARKAHALTRRRFGRVIQMYAPLYLSNECVNACAYCGFSRKNEVRRRTLTPEEALQEARLLHDAGFRHVLLVSGESPRHVNAGTIAAFAASIQDLFPSISIEVQPLSEADYGLVIAHGVDGLVSYQETYSREQYETLHPRGPKSDFSFRLATAERGGRAGFRRVGIGALLGLSDWRAEGFLLGLHAAYLQKKFWKTQVTISFPRLRPASGGYAPPVAVDDGALVQLFCALRLFLPDCGLVLSTREPPDLREHLLPLGVTQMSAGSRTEPGGYKDRGDAEEQFRIHDDRAPSEVAGSVLRLGYEPIWKDWDAAFLKEGRGP